MNNEWISDWDLLTMSRKQLVNYVKGMRMAEEFNFDVKCEWHDLRKNPNDLPPLNQSILFATDDGSVQEGEMQKYAWIQYRWNGKRDSREVLAWCETPKFKR